MKSLLRRLLNSFGFDVVRFHKPAKSRRTDRLSFYRTHTGDYYLPTDAHADHIAHAIKCNEIYDKPIYEVAKKYVKPGSIALDLGSNFGQMAILMSKMVGPHGKVHAFEADEFVYSVLDKNARANAQNIVTHYGAVHDESNQTLYFPVQDFERFGCYGSYGIDYVHGRGRPVKTLTVDDLQMDAPVSFMKVDVQGGDLFAMRGAVKTIARHRMPILFEYEFVFEEELGLCFQDYVNFVQEIDYRFSRVIDGANFLITPTEN